ncbi:MAG TPA: hypothetical protein VEF34_01630 [Syntrophobacteraceae bacterium]|nr:hypothetical protein [Syntrophobacteraceae bacterium]
MGNIARSELHLFSYLACLLSLYKNHPVADWEYGFAVTQQGHPFSPDIDEALGVLFQIGHLVRANSYLKTSMGGVNEYNILKSLQINAEREPFLDGACASLLALPVGTIRHALSQEPDIRNAVSLSQSRKLLTDSSLDMLYDQFATLSKAIGVDVDDLMVPSVVWLTYLSQIDEVWIRGNQCRWH